MKNGHNFAAEHKQKVMAAIQTKPINRLFPNEGQTVAREEKFENPAVTGKIPEGYMTGDEFESRLLGRIKIFYKENGIL